jgi:transcriptional regulator with XRE-family HTH domain
VTKTDKTRQDLSIEQQNAIEMLITGQSDAQVAEAVGVSRQTVWQWRNRDAYFRAELFAKRASLYSEYQDALRALVPEALAVLRQSLSSEDEHIRLRAVSLLLKASALEIGTVPEALSAERIKRDDYFSS